MKTITLKPVGMKKLQVNDRKSANERGYNYQWRKATQRFKMENPLCVECLAEGRVTAVQVVDHIVPHKGDVDLFWDRGNWQSLCKKHHSQKTAKQDGGFGNRVKKT